VSNAWWLLVVIGGILIALGLAITITVVASHQDADREGIFGITLGIFKLSTPTRSALALILVILGLGSTLFFFEHTKIEHYFDSQTGLSQGELSPRTYQPLSPPPSTASSSTPPASPPSSTDPPPPPPVTPPTATRPPAPRAFVSTTVQTREGAVSVYVGKRGAIMNRLKGLVTFNVNDPSLKPDQTDMCVETAISQGYKGSSVTLTVTGLGIGWHPGEVTPSPEPEIPAGFVHQQMVQLPSDATDKPWPISIVLDDNGKSQTFGPVNVTHGQTGDGAERWGIDGEAAECV
jgi:hypothetical protein